jgi:hypothetical protein
LVYLFDKTDNMRRRNYFSVIEVISDLQVRGFLNLTCGRIE